MFLFFVFRYFKHALAHKSGSISIFNFRNKYVYKKKDEDKGLHTAQHESNIPHKTVKKVKYPLGTLVYSNALCYNEDLQMF